MDEVAYDRELKRLESQLNAGDKILLIEAMKTFNDIVAPHGGTVTAIFVDDKQPVEFGQILMSIE